MLDLNTEHRALPRRVVVQRLILLVQVDRRLETPLRLGHPRDMIDMRVRQQDVADTQSLFSNEPEQLLYFITRIDVDGGTGALAPQHVAVLLKWPLRRSPKDHCTRILG